MYFFQSRVRYSEISKNGSLDLASIINYFQDCSTFQSEDQGVGISYLSARNQAWLLSSWQIIVNRYPKLCENITIGTWAYDFKDMYGYRNFIIKDAAECVLAVANSIWILVDTSSGLPIRINPDYAESYGREACYPMDYLPRKIKLPKELFPGKAFQVIKSNIDTNHHVNNGQYIKMAEEYLPDEFFIYQMRADYRRAALLGDEILPLISSEENRCTVVLADALKKPYAVVEFTKKP